MRIGELSRRTDVSTETLRYYEKRGLITAQRRDNGYRDFDGATVRLVGLLRLGQSLGFSLAQMQKIVAATTRQEMDAQEVAVLLTDKMSEIDAKIDQMVQMKALLAETLTQVCPLQGQGQGQG